MEKLALLSVSDKRGLVEFATALVNQHGYRLLSTGGTYRALQKAGMQPGERVATTNSGVLRSELLKNDLGAG